MFTLMEDPVILPESKVTVDRGTITSHLLSDANDPFNRRPLTIDQVIPGKIFFYYSVMQHTECAQNLDDALKAEIDKWKASLKK